MSVRVVRSSKYRHIFGQAMRKELCYDGLKITKSTQDGQFCAANNKFVAVCCAAAGGGAFIVLTHTETGRVDINHPKVTGHKGEILDLAWCPFNDNLIASSSEDGTIKIWEIPDTGLEENLDEPLVSLDYHQRRVPQILWHPSAANIILSCGHDDLILVWNAEEGEVVCEIAMPSTVFCVCWNEDGSRIATTSKDKMIRILDPRTGAVIEEGQGHEGAKPQRITYVGEDKLFTTGFSRMSERQYALWDATDLSNSVIIENLDTTNGTLFPMFDSDTGVLYLGGKGDGSIRYFEITDEPPFVHYLNTFSSSAPQRGLGMINKRGCNVNNNEVTRIYKLHTKGLVEPISFIVPRKSELYQADLYPDTASDEPAVSAEEWVNGKNAKPKTMSMKEFFVETVRETKGTKAKVGLLAKKSTVKAAVGGAEAAPAEEKKKPKVARVAVAAAPAKKEEPAPVKEERPPPKREEPPKMEEPPKKEEPKREIKKQPAAAASAPAKDPRVDELMEEIKRLKDTLKQHEDRIKVLEAQGTAKISELLKEIQALSMIVKKHEERIEVLEHLHTQ